MNQADFVADLAERADISKADAERAVKAMPEVITKALKKGEEVRLSGIGIFETKETASRNGRNPRTGESITIPASKSVRFKAAKPLKDALNG